MRIFSDHDIQDTIAACKKAALSFDHRFYTTDKRLEEMLLKAASIIETYHVQAVEQQQTVATSDGKKLEAILENLKNMSTDITALNEAIVTLTTAYQAQHTAIQEILAKNAASPTPVDYSEQINNINNIIGQIGSDDASINTVLQPVLAPDPSATPQVPPTAAQSAVTGSTPPADTSSTSTTTGAAGDTTVAGAGASAVDSTTPNDASSSATTATPSDASENTGLGVTPADSSTTPPPATI